MLFDEQPVIKPVCSLTRHNATNGSTGAFYYSGVCPRQIHNRRGCHDELSMVE